MSQSPNLSQTTRTGSVPNAVKRVKVNLQNVGSVGRVGFNNQLVNHYPSIISSKTLLISENVSEVTSIILTLAATPTLHDLE